MAGQKANSMQQSQYTCASSLLALLGFQLSCQAISIAFDNLAPEVAILDRLWLQWNMALPRAVQCRSDLKGRASPRCPASDGITGLPCWQDCDASEHTDVP